MAKLLRFAAPRMVGDGLSFEVVAENSAPMRVECSLDDAVEAAAFLIRSLQFVAAQNPMPPGSGRQDDLLQIPCSGVGAQWGETRDVAVLAVDLGGYLLGFRMPATTLAETERDLAAMLRG